jgi:hypothetical protein
VLLHRCRATYHSTFPPCRDVVTHRGCEDGLDRASCARPTREEVGEGKGSTGAAAGGGAIYGLGIFGALFYFRQQADAFWEYIWAVFPKAILWPAFIRRRWRQPGDNF